MNTKYVRLFFLTIFVITGVVVFIASPAGMSVFKSNGEKTGELLNQTVNSEDNSRPDAVRAGIKGSTTAETTADQSGNSGKPNPSAVPLIESTLASASGLNVDAIGKLLESEKFNYALDRLQSQGGADGHELSRIYSEALATDLKSKDSKTSLDNIACGLSICGVVFSSELNEEQFLDWMMSSGQSSGARMYSSALHQIPPTTPEGRTTYRMIFATDPKFTSITVPRF